MTRAQLQSLCSPTRNNPRASLSGEQRIVLADGRRLRHENEIMRRAIHFRKAHRFWRWQARYLDEGNRRPQARQDPPPRFAAAARENPLKVIVKTVQETPPNATHWRPLGPWPSPWHSPSSVGAIWSEAGLKARI